MATVQVFMLYRYEMIKDNDHHVVVSNAVAAQESIDRSAWPRHQTC